MNAQTIQQETAKTNKALEDNRTIVFFDGVCGLCNSSVNFLMKIDRNRTLVFTPLQGDTAKEILPKSLLEDLNTIVVRVDGKNHLRSSGVIRALWSVGGIWSVFGSVFWIVPKPIRDLCYKMIAAMRYRLFGKKDSCRMPTPEERQCFLP